MDLRLALMAGIDIPIPECQLTVRQPKIKDIGYIGEEDFFIGVQTLTLNKSMFVDENALSALSNFQIFMKIMTEKETANKKSAVFQICPLFFPNSKVFVTPRSFVINSNDNSITIDESNFDFLQERIGDICCLKTGAMDQHSFNPQDKKAKEIAEKLMKARQRVAQQKGESTSSLFSQYVSTLSVGLGMPLQRVLDLTIYQLYDLIERYSLYLNWDLDIRSRLAGGKPDSQADNWMKNIH